MSDEFDIFWAIYRPLRGKHPNPKVEARNEFAKSLKRGNSPSDIIAGTKAFAEYHRSEGTDPRMVPHARRYLLRDHWLDYVPTEEEAAEAEESRDKALRAMADIVIRGERPTFISDENMDDMLEGGYIKPEHANAVGYKPKVKVA